jgi:tetratricopeptide (TPR) repeat protein
MDYTKYCFVIMPYKKKTVEITKDLEREVDFDAVYQTVFEPAIREATLPEGGHLEPRRCDRDQFASSIDQDMFEYLEYSRLAIVDITGLNANVMYELGVRHRARPTGTIIFRQTGSNIPFDIKTIRAFDYDGEPPDAAEQSRQNVTTMVRQTLQENRLDSPVQLALRAQQASGNLDALLRQAEEQVREEKWSAAQATYAKALEEQPNNVFVRTRLGLLFKDQGQWAEALKHFEQAVASAPEDAVALREQGIALNKLRGATDVEAGTVPLVRAMELAPNDYDAVASLAGIRKRQGRLDLARDLYRQATDISRGNSYPLLNLLKIEATLAGKLELDDKRRFQLQRAERALTMAVARQPPADPPWSFFDLAECRLYAGDRDGFLHNIDLGLLASKQSWQPKTFRSSLQLLVEGRVQLPGLADGIELLAKGEELMS